MTDDVTERTIADFGAQWTSYRRNEGYYASQMLFRDICGPHFDVADMEAARVLDVGSGTGRIVRMILEAGARQVIAVEPSKAFEVLRENTADLADRITYQNVRGDQFSARDVDIAVSFGVLHHIRDPEPTVRNIYAALKPGATCIVWLYGYEGNMIYLALIGGVRAVTRRLPDTSLSALCHIANVALAPYVAACRVLPLPLPMRAYMRGHFAKLGWHERFLTIFDQINPSYAKYYRREEAVDLLSQAGFVDVAAYNRPGYSSTVVARKPNAEGSRYRLSRHIAKVSMGQRA